MRELPPHQLGGDISAGQDQRTRRTSAERGHAHTNDICRGALQLGQRTGNPRLLDCVAKETGREEQSSPTFDLQ